MCSSSSSSQGSSAAVCSCCSADRAVVATIWENIEQLLGREQQEVAAFMRQLADALPCLAAIPTDELPALVALHMSSARHLMATIKLLVPHAFNQDSAEPDMAVICSLTGTAESMVARLMDLQLLQLVRAKQITRHMRMRVLQPKLAQLQQQELEPQQEPQQELEQELEPQQQELADVQFVPTFNPCYDLTDTAELVQSLE